VQSCGWLLTLRRKVRNFFNIGDKGMGCGGMDWIDLAQDKDQ
jgi:hypothetical protein